MDAGEGTCNIYICQTLTMHLETFFFLNIAFLRQLACRPKLWMQCLFGPVSDDEILTWPSLALLSGSDGSDAVIAPAN